MSFCESVGAWPQGHPGKGPRAGETVTGFLPFEAWKTRPSTRRPVGVARHIREYVETDGRKGHRWNGVPTLLLTTRGRRTGKLRRTALIYGRDGDAYVVVASRGGARHHPQWYLNLAPDPEVESRWVPTG